ncbi:MAG: hypothetical protein JST51_20620 [Armatimonadetes bacterium]|nr:hypothetical protein [Armatimonadota bacterium]
MIEPRHPFMSEPDLPARHWFNIALDIVDLAVPLVGFYLVGRAAFFLHFSPQIRTIVLCFLALLAISYAISVVRAVRRRGFRILPKAGNLFMIPVAFFFTSQPFLQRVSLSPSVLYGILVAVAFGFASFTLVQHEVPTAKPQGR